MIKPTSVHLITLFVLCLLASTITTAQPNTLVMGNIKNVSLVDVIDLQVNQKYTSAKVDEYSSNVLEDGSFAFAVEIKEPQLAMITYSRNKALIYLEPNDTLYISAEANSFQYSLEFSGRGGYNNTHFFNYIKENPQELNLFNLVQYRKGTYWYSVSPQMDDWMISLDRERYTSKMRVRKERAQADFDFYAANHSGKITKDYKEFINSEILYDWAYHLLLYGNVFKNKYKIQDDFFDFLNEVPLQASQIGNYYYRHFLQAYFSYENEKSNTEKDPYVAQYEKSYELISGKALAFFQSEMIVQALRAKHTEAIMNSYAQYFKTTPYSQFDEKLTDSFSQAMKFKEGTPAPDFSLTDINGSTVSLSKYKGKVIFLNFWASWCRPCMKKMDAMKDMQTELEQSGVVFLNVSLDREKEKWVNVLNEKAFKGVQILADGNIDAAIATKYEVSALPEYYIINKRGNFVQKPKKYNKDEIKVLLVSEASKPFN